MDAEGVAPLSSQISPDRAMVEHPRRRYVQGMASTLTKILMHVAFSTKHREPLIEPQRETDLYAYIGGICRDLGSPLMTMGGTEDHVHMLVSLAKTTALSDLLLHVKRGSSTWMGRGFAWQEGYFAFSIGESGVPRLKRYIARQREHHAKVSFKDEMRAFLRKYNVEWNEQYVWD